MLSGFRVAEFGVRFRVQGESGVCAKATAARLFQEQLLYRNVKRFRGRHVFKAQRLLYHSTLGLRVIKKKKKKGCFRFRICASRASGF